MEDEIKEVEKLMIIENEMKKYITVLNAASFKIRTENATQFPIFVASKETVALGIPLIDRARNRSNWAINVSSLEEFAEKNLIYDKKLDEFRSTYKDPDSHICFFVLSDIGAQFLFIPIEQKEED